MRASKQGDDDLDSPAVLPLLDEAAPHATTHDDETPAP